MTPISRGAACFALALGFGCGGSVDDHGETQAPGSGGSAGAGGTTGGTSGGQGGSLAASGNGGSGASAGTNGSDSGTAGRCDLPPDPGPCDAAMPRFYFDPAYVNCREFTYGGCEGNANNFENNYRCMLACQRGFVVSCNRCLPDGGCVEDCSGCLKTPDADGLPCDELNYRCSFGTGCGTPYCTCLPRSPTSQSLAWRCTSNLC